MTERYVLLGLAGARAAWFAAIGQWSNAGYLPVDFVKCVSTEQLRVRLTSGRAFSAVILDAALPTVDRDLCAAAHDAGAAVIVVDTTSRPDHWVAMGADAVLRDAFAPGELTDALRTHSAMIPTGEWPAATARPARANQTGFAPLIAVSGAGGTGASTVSMALAQQLAVDKRIRPSGVVLADLRLRAEQGVLHDAGDVGPGIQELVEHCRTVSPDAEQIRSHTFHVAERGYALLLGLRQATAWSALRPRAISTALAGLRRAFDAVVCDCESDVEGQADGGSIDVEERNALARAAMTSADAVIVVGLAGAKGVYSMARVIVGLTTIDVDAGRIVPVFNRVNRSTRARARLAQALAALLPEDTRQSMQAAVFLPERDIEDAIVERRRLPAALGDPLVSQATMMSADANASRVTHRDEGVPRRIRSGELAAWTEEVSAT